MSREFYIKKFEGDRDKKGYFNELAASRKFPEIAPTVISTDEKELRLVYDYIQGDVTECGDSTMSNIGHTLSCIHTSFLSLQPWKDSWLLGRPMMLRDESIKTKLLEAKAKIATPQTGIIHGDYRRRNIISTPNGVKVIDWEYMATDFIYWDIGVFVADFVHQKYHGIQTNNLNAFWSAYTNQVPMNKEEINFGILVGASWIIADHVIPEERKPVPENLFVNFNDEEKKYLLDPQNYQ